MGKYKMKDLVNGDKWYFDNIVQLRKEAVEYNESCEGDWLPVYRIYNPDTFKYRLMTAEEIKAARLPH